MAHHRVWLFRPPPDREDEFRKAYGSEGAWSLLFRSGDGYLGTRLLQPTQPGGWWMTIDSWASEAAFESFQAQHGSDYRALDEQLEGVAGEEQFVGAFDEP